MLRNRQQGAGDRKRIGVGSMSGFGKRPSKVPSMNALGRNPKIIKLARDLGLPIRGDCASHIAKHARHVVDRIVQDSIVRVTDLETLRRVVADKLRVKLEFIYSDADIELL